LFGSIDASARARLDEILDKARDCFRFLRVREEGLHTFLGKADLAILPTEGWLAKAVAELHGDIPGTSEAERSQALRLLHSFYRAAS
jgi:hypothetical protein